METLTQWDLQLVHALQQMGGLTGVMKAFTFLGTENFFLLFLPVVYWCVDSAVGLRLGVILLSVNSLNATLKLAFHLPRPYWIDTRVQALSTELSYGLPSGHAMDATAIWGFTAAQIKKRWAWPAALCLIFLISLSRVYLGVHFGLDVLAGWLFGGLLLWAILKWEASTRAWLGRLSLAAQIGLALLISLMYLGLNLGLLGALAATPDPAAWAGNAAAAAPPAAGEPAIDPRNPDGVASAAGALFGLGVGLALVARGQLFNAGGPVLKRVLRFAVGLVGVLVFWLGLKYVLPAEPLALGLAFRFLRYALTVLWVIYLAPWVFRRANL